jgi:beta-lactamase regulating signal transducer with metallopeptidase domain
MLQVLITIALKSLLVAGLTLAILQIMRARSAAERSWVAHVGLLALVILAVAPLAPLPRWKVEAPALYSQPAEVSGPAISPQAPAAPAPSVVKSAAPIEATNLPNLTAPAPARFSINPASAAAATYALPAFALLLITLVAFLRLVALQARADVLVDGHWLSALARAQRRMGFKHGTALLTSDELASPISWGLLRPVILLNSRAVEASGEAEAIISHELAHVARMDWIKLLLARVATALFWFNPLVWILAREAHQLREEAADDSVLAADIVDTDYAQLLVGVARHECPSLLLGAHGVAPSKNSLARRVARVLDDKLTRGPVAGSFATSVFVGALAVATPLAALTLAPPAAKAQARSSKAPVVAPQAEVAAAEVPADLPHIIARGVSASVATATAAIAQRPVKAPPALQDFELKAPGGGIVKSAHGVVVAQAASGASVTTYPPDAQGRQRLVAVGPDGATAIAYAESNGMPSHHRDPATETAIELKALGITPEYVVTMRSASPALRNADTDAIIQLRAVGATPEYIRALTRAGFGNLDADDIKQLKAFGVSPEYMRAIRATGLQPSADELLELRALNVSPEELARMRGSGVLTRMRIKQLIRLRPPAPPAPPPPLSPPDPDDG